jgi:hypothetical protein
MSPSVRCVHDGGCPSKVKGSGLGTVRSGRIRAGFAAVPRVLPPESSAGALNGLYYRFLGLPSTQALYDLGAPLTLGGKGLTVVAEEKLLEFRWL